MKINPNGFREYDARWVFEKDIDLEGIADLGKGLGTQVIKHSKNANATREGTQTGSRISTHTSQFQ